MQKESGSGSPKRPSVGRAALRVLAGRGSVAVASVVFVGYLARVLPSSTLGLVAVHATVVMSAKILADLGLGYAVIREASPRVEAGDLAGAVEDVIGPVSILRGAVGAGLAVTYGAVLFGLADTLAPLFPGVELRVVAPFAALHLFAKNLQYVASPILFAHEKFGLDAAIDSGAMLAEKVGAVACYLALGVDHLFTGMFLGQAALTLFAIASVRSTAALLRPRQAFAPSLGRTVRAARGHYVRVLARQGPRQADRFLIAFLLPMEAMAVFHVARQGSTYLRYVVRAFADPLMRRLASEQDPGRRHAHVRTARIFCVLVPLLMAGASPWLMQALGGEAYAASWPVLAVLAASYVFYGLSEIQLAVITMLGHGRESVRQDVWSAVIGVAATAVLVVLFGDDGMAWGQLVAFLVLYLAGRALTRHIWNTPTVGER